MTSAAWPASSGTARITITSDISVGISTPSASVVGELKVGHSYQVYAERLMKCQPESAVALRQSVVSGIVPAANQKFTVRIRPGP